MSGWKTIAVYSPDFQVLLQIITNGHTFFVINYLSGEMKACGTLGEAMGKMMEGRFLN
jgi:hypothetical protein